MSSDTVAKRINEFKAEQHQMLLNQINQELNSTYDSVLYTAQALTQVSTTRRNEIEAYLTENTQYIEWLKSEKSRINAMYE